MTRKLTYRDGVADTRDFQLPDRDRRKLCSGEVKASALADAWAKKLARAQKSSIRADAKLATTNRREVSAQIRRYLRGMKTGIKAAIDEERKGCRRR